MKQPLPAKLAVALTGNIGSGKSLAAAWLAKKGCKVVNADYIGHELLSDAKIKTDIINVFGKGIISAGEIDRKKLGKIVFSDPHHLHQLNQIIHPRLAGEIEKRIKNFKKGRDSTQEMQSGNCDSFIFFEIAVLFEIGIENLFDITLNITSTKHIRHSRLSQRDRLNGQEIEQRMSRQLPDHIKQEKADINIHNNCRIECLYDKMQLFYTMLKLLAAKY